MNQDCELHADALARYAAGQLDTGPTGRVEAHLSGCASCRESLAVIRAVRRSPLEPPPGLEARLQIAAREAARAPATSTAAGRARRSWWARVPQPSALWRPWALPLAAAATVAVLWLGVTDGDRGPDPEARAGEAVEAEYEPFGAWPAADGMVAGDPLLGELSVEELELLLEEMES